MIKKEKFIPGKTYIPSCGKVFDKNEINNIVEAAKEGWWTEGRFSSEFEKKFKKLLDVNYVTLVNSGSSANLVALAALTSKAFGEKRLVAEDEFITTAVAFPTTVNPPLIYGLKPIFIDAELDTLNIDANKIEKAITSKTKLIMVAHTLGKPFDLDKIMDLVRKYNLWLIEDCCDALGSKYNNKYLGTFGHIATFSFYPAHHITMGEGGAVITNNSLIHRAVRQFRDWGRHCWCGTGHDNTCGKRFKWQLGELPYGYDHKHIYSEIGFNLKLTDFQAAIGVAQLKKLPGFIEVRKKNYSKLYNFFKKHNQFFILMRKNKKENVSYFGFPLVVQKKAPFTRKEFIEYLEGNQIATRNVFAGNILRHPAYVDLKNKCTIIGSLKNADLILNNGFWIGIYPGIDSERISYMKKIIEKFLKKYINKND